MANGSDAEFDQLGMEVEVRRVQPYEANKPYLCPGCNQDIPRGTGHIVACLLYTSDAADE